MSKQINFIEENNGTINFYQGDGSQSKDEILKARFTADVADRIRAFCRGRGISTTEYLRQYAKLGDVYFDHIETLINDAHVIIPLLEKITSKE